MKTRLMMIGIDSGDLDLLLPWISRGELPNFAKIFNDGAYGQLLSKIPITPVAWSSIYTGLDPGKHGVFDFKNARITEESYHLVIVNSSSRGGEDVWEILGSHGKKVVVVNAPLTYPVRPVNGFLVAGFMAPGVDYEFTYPTSLRSEIRRMIPRYEIGATPSHVKSFYLKQLHSAVKMVRDLAMHLLQKIDWDFAFVVFKETDEVQHAFYHQPHRILALYRRIDNYLGELLKLTDENTYVVIVSDHGTGPAVKQFHVAEYLRRRGIMSVPPTPISNRMIGLGTLGLSRLRLLWVPAGLRLLLKSMLKVPSMGGFWPSTRVTVGHVDWSKTLAYVSEAQWIGWIGINLKDREKFGIVQPQDYEAVRTWLAKQFIGVEDPDSPGVVLSALRREEVVSGPRSSEAPDLLLLPEQGYLLTTSSSINNSLFSKNLLWTGSHSPRGLIAIRGPGVMPGRITGATLVDVMPTILYAMRLTIPGGIDGKVLSSAFTPKHIKENPILKETDAEAVRIVERGLSEEEEMKMEERLRQLGYLG